MPVGATTLQMKRAFDVVVSVLAIGACGPLMGLIAVAVRIDSNGPVLFRQNRVGREFRTFRLYKFRSMKVTSDGFGPSITSSGDDRVTQVGRLLRRTKLDELPQLFNVLKGDMSLVGPRPELPKYVELYRKDYVELLRVRPGLTDPASIHFRNEESLLASYPVPEDGYVLDVLPAKIALSRRYVENISLIGDLRLILDTLVKVIVT